MIRNPKYFEAWSTCPSPGSFCHHGVGGASHPSRVDYWIESIIIYEHEGMDF